MPGLRSRWLLRGLLGACLLTLLAVAARDYQVRQPAYLLRRAREARVRGDRASALIFLRELLARDPKNADGHLLFAAVCLEAAREKNPAARLATVTPALEHYRDAAALRPRDAGLQRAVMNAEARCNRLPDAAAAAERLLVLRADDADAHYLLAARAVRDRDDKAAERHLRALSRVETPPHFRTLALSAERLEQVHADEELDAVLARAATEALAVSARPEALAALAPNDQASLLALLFQNERLAPCVPEALARAGAAMTVLERLAALAGDDGCVTREIAQHAAFLLQTLETHLAAASSRTGPPVHLALLARFETLAAAAIEAETANPAIAERAALAAIACGDDDRARALLGQSIRTFERQPSVRPDDLAALRLLLVRRQFVAGQGRATEPMLEVLLQTPATLGWAELLLGALRLDEGKDVEGLIHLTRGRERLGDRPLVRVAFARAFLAQRRWPEAVDQLNALDGSLDRLDAEARAWVAQTLGDRADLHRLIAWSYAELERWPQAQPHLDALKGTRHAGWAVRVSAARRAGEQGPEGAVSTLEGARQVAPARLDLVLSEAALLTARGQDDAAAAVLERFAAARPDDLAAQAALLRWRLSRGRTEPARAEAEALVARLPHDPTARLLHAETRLATGDPETALALCRALADDAGLAQSAPEVYRAAPLIGALAAARLDRRPEAAEFLAQAARAPQTAATRTLTEGGRALVSGDYATACSKLADALAYTTVRAAARVALTQAVLALAAGSSPDAADATLDRLLEQHPNEPIVRTLRIELAVRQDRFADALAQIDRLAALPSSRDEAESLRVLVWARRAQWHHARTAAQDILKRRPDDLRTRLLLAHVLLVQHQECDALAETDEAVRRAPGNVETVLLRADALESLGRREEAIASLETFAARQPRLATPWLRLSLLYAATGQAEQAHARLETARGLTTDPTTLLRVEIQDLCRLGTTDAAEVRARQATGDDPTTAQALAVSEAFAAERQWKPALAWSEKALAHASDSLRPKLQARAADLLVLQAGTLPTERHALLEAACDRWRAVLAQAPADLVAANNLAWYLGTELAQPREAYTILARAGNGLPVEELPEQLIATLATIDRRLDRLTEAQTLLERRVALRPEEPLAHFHLGLVYQAEKRPAVARQSLLRALQLGLDDDHATQARAALEGTVVR